MTLPLQYRLVSSGDLTGFLSVVPCDRSFDWELGMSDGCSGFLRVSSSVVCVLLSFAVLSRFVSPWAEIIIVILSYMHQPSP